MSWQSRHRYVLRVTAEDGEQAMELLLQPDLDSAIRCCHLEGMRSGALPARTEAPPARIRPVWDPARGAPFVNGFEIAFGACDEPAYAGQVPVTCLSTDIVTAIADLTRNGRIAQDTNIRTAVCAFLDPAWNERASAREDDAGFEPIDEPLSLSPLSLDPVLGRCQRHSDLGREMRNMPLILPKEVLTECTERSRAAGDVEVGGFLLGRLYQDPETAELAVVVRAQIPARYTSADHTSLKFTARTWADADAAIALRNDNEVIAGWYHSHPEFCARCPESRRRHCAYSRPFFSEADRSVHRAAFASAWSVALLVSWLGGHEPSLDMYGWQDGRIEAREFHVTTREHIRSLARPAP